MDEFKNRLKNISKLQETLAQQLEDAAKEYESHDFIQENNTLRTKYEDTMKKLEELKTIHSKLEYDNSKLRQALKEQILDEKLSILKVSKEKIDTYFRSTIAPHHNKLKEFEETSLQEIQKLNQTAERDLKIKEHAIKTQLQQLRFQLDQMLKEHREILAKEEIDMLKGREAHFVELASEEVSEEVMQKRMKQNEMEMKIGLGWINKIGILLIILGVGAAFRYTYANWFNDYFKGALFFILGGLMLAGGEWFYRKHKQTFAFGLLGGGIAVLYGSIFFSYFLLEIISIYPALLLSVMVTATAVILSLRYESKTICSFGLIGGYLPLYSYLFAFGLDGFAVYAAMVYVLLLNLAILWITLQKQWNVVKYLSFIFYIPSMLVLIDLSASDLISMGYSIITFVLYLAMTLGYSLKHKVVLKAGDVVLLGFNTFISCSVMYFLFDSLDWNDFRGVLALVFCLSYFGLGKLIERVMAHEKQTKVLFYATSLTFAVLMIPFQFALEWIALGWLVEAVVLMVYGNKAKLKALEKAGWGIFALCLGAFFLEVYGRLLFPGISATAFQFNFKYTAIMVGMLLVTIYYLLVQQRSNTNIIVFERFKNLISYMKYFTLANVWIYLLYESYYLYEKWVPNTSGGLYHFYQFMLYAFVTIILSYVLTKVPLIYDRVVKYYSVFLYCVGSLIGLFVTIGIPTLRPQLAQNTAIEYLALGLLIAFNIIIFFAGRDLLLAFIKQQYKNLEIYPLTLAVYLLAVMAAFINVQFQLSDVGFVFSTVFLIIAIGYIFYGFKRKFVYVRRLGLGVTLFSTGKLIIYDLTFLSEGSKIVAYFLFGLALLGISYMYQKVSSLQEADSNDDVQM